MATELSQASAASAIEAPSRQESRQGWTRDEDEIIRRCVQMLGSKWGRIAAELPGRTAHAIRNRYHRLRSLDADAPPQLEAKLQDGAPQHEPWVLASAVLAPPSAAPTSTVLAPPETVLPPPETVLAPPEAVLAPPAAIKGAGVSHATYQATTPPFLHSTPFLHSPPHFPSTASTVLAPVSSAAPVPGLWPLSAPPTVALQGRAAAVPQPYAAVLQPAASPTYSPLRPMGCAPLLAAASCIAAAAPTAAPVAALTPFSPLRPAALPTYSPGHTGSGARLPDYGANPCLPQL